MLSSMTGFGKGMFREGSIQAEAEIKSLNSRYLDLSIKLPKQLSHKEFEVREKIKKNLGRGKISVYLSLTNDTVEDNLGKLNAGALGSIMKMLTEIKKITGVKEEIGFDHLLAFQNFLFDEDDEELEKEFEIILKALDIAIESVVKMRQQEGLAILTDLKERLILMENGLEFIENGCRPSIDEYFNKIKARAVELLNGISVNSERLELELALLAEKYDFTEECVRLRSHINLFREALDKGTDAGRKLNFICQEMNREANTINSKAVAAEIGHQGIILKEEIEKIREQIQNIE